MRTILRVTTFVAVAALAFAAAADARPEAARTTPARISPSVPASVTPTTIVRPLAVRPLAPTDPGGGGIVASCGFPGGVLSIELDLGWSNGYYIGSAWANVYWPGHSSTSIWSYMRMTGVPIEGEGIWTAQYHHGDVPTYGWWARLNGYGHGGTPVGWW